MGLGAADVSVVVVTRNRRAELLSSLSQLCRPGRCGQVIVIDNASDDGTVEAVEEAFPQVVVTALPANLGAAARNIGLRQATTPLVAFSDDDSWWESGSLDQAAARFAADPALAVLAARILVGPECRLDPTCKVMAGSRWDERLIDNLCGGRGVTGFIACGTVVRRRAMLGVGGFEAHLLIGGEEELVALDLAVAGWKLVYDPAVVAHHHPSSARESRRRVRLQIRNRILTAWLRYPPRAALGRSLPSRHGEQDVDPRPAWAAAVADAVRSAGWVASRRAPVPGHVAGVFTA